ncbi:MAG: IS110 family transposase [bacterium]|nr:IS110 family transposase [bacterium]
MTKNNFNKQVSNRQRITSTTLIIGADIGCKSNMICLMKHGGEEIGYCKIYNSTKGFKHFDNLVKKTMSEGGFDDVLMGMEPTGSYWRKLALYSMESGIDVKLIRTTALKHQRGLDESSPGKSDKRDAYTLANIVREGKYIDSVIDDGLYQDLRRLVRMRENVISNVVRVKNKLRRIIDDYFPELQDFYSSLNAKGLFAVLRECPFPEAVLRYGQDALIDLISRASRSRKEGKKKGLKIFASAKNSIGLKRVNTIVRYELKEYLDDLNRFNKRLEEIGKMMGELLLKIPCARYILSIPGMGIISTGSFLGELGNPDNFDNSRKIVKYAGYDPVGYDSGMYISKKHISKKGRWRLRKILYFMCLCAIRLNPYFKNKYEKKQNGGKLAKKAAICAVVIDLIKIIFALIRDKREYEDRIELVKIAA